MAKIIQLSEHVANMIAAGEVVESPLSVVKELVENSIDAHASVIQIHLEDAGIKRIEIVDNGCGMNEEDALMAFNRHATSKISTAYDLASINTLGFRGEALPSIASVSLLELSTKEEGAEDGIKVTFKAGKLISKESTALNKGTKIVVSNLFYNTPARLKYLKSPNVILASICELVDKLALANRSVRFLLTNNKQVLLNTNGIDDIKNLFGMIYGSNVAKNIVTNQKEFDGIKVTATFTNPTITRSRKNDITLVVNNRYVKSSIVTNAVVDAYKNYVAPLRYPICLIDLDIDSLLIDVNVHPQKMEIKFSSEQQVYDLVKETIVEGIKNITIIPTLDNEVKREKIEPINFDDYLDQIVEEETIDTPKVVLQEEVKVVYKPAVETKKEEIVVKKEVAKFPYLEYIGQFSGTYLIFQNDEGLYLIDQHAAQERINYEYYFNVLANPKKESVALLIPTSFELKKEEAIILKANLDKLENVGFVIDEVGINSFFIREIPTWIKADNTLVMIEKIIYFLLERNVFDVSLLRDSLAKQIACKASIKANHYLSKEEVNVLISDLKKCENPFNCPHGRPVFIKMTHYEIEKLFKRVV